MRHGLLARTGDARSIEGELEFCIPGTSLPYPPDDSGPGGSAARRPLAAELRGVRWAGSTIRDNGVDMAIDLAQELFVDYVQVTVAGAASVSRAGLYVLSEAGSPMCLSTTFPGDPSPLPVRLGAQIGSNGDGETTLVLAVGRRVRRLIARLITSFRDLAVTGLQIWGSDAEAFAVYPRPVTWATNKDPTGAGFHTPAPLTVGFVEDSNGDAQFAASFLVDLIGGSADPRGLTTSGGEQKRLDDSPALLFRLQTSGAPSATPDPPGYHSLYPESYTVCVSQTRVTVDAPSRLALLYAASTVAQILEVRGPTLTAPCGTLADRPAHPLRGIHIGLPAREDIDFLKRLIRYLVVPYRYNTVFLEFGAGMELHRHPEIGEAWRKANERAARGEEPPIPHGDMVAAGGVLTQDEVRDLVSFLRDHGLEVVPEIQSLSHVQYLTMSHPEFAEVPEAKEAAGETNLSKDDERPKGYPHCYCPEAPGVYELMSDIMDEIIEVAEPRRFVHLGHDEVYQIGTCPRCRHLDKGKLFADDVIRLSGYARNRGLRSIIWSDMLQPVRNYGTEGALDLLPKDIIMLDFVWYFHLDQDLEDTLRHKGFAVAMGNLYSSHYPRFASRIRKPGMIGGQVSTWRRADLPTLAATGKLYDFLYTSEMLWSDRYDERLRWSIDDALRARIPLLRKRLGIDMHKRSEPAAPSDPGGVEGPRAFEPVMLPTDQLVDHATLQQLDPALLIAAEARYRKVVAVSAPHTREPLASRVTVPVNAAAHKLYFAHALTRRCPLETVVGRYVIEYDDGGEESVELENGYNVSVFRRRHDEPLAHPAYRHFGYPATFAVDAAWEGHDANGAPLTIYGLEWHNPHRHRTIRAVRVEAGDDRQASPLVVFMISAQLS